MRKFLWGGSGSDRKMSWVSWDCVASPPLDRGGLGIRKLGDINRSLLLKWAWRSWEFLPLRSSLGGVWKSIVNYVDRPLRGSDRFRHFVKGIVGDGSNIAFWLDPWLRKEPLRFCFPNLFQLETDKRCCVRARIISPFSNPSAAWRWKSPPNSNAELAEWSALCVLLRDICLSVGSHKWWWENDVSGVFSVKSAFDLLSHADSDVSRVVWEWGSLVPIKCNVFAWRALLERLPTRVELLKRNIQVPEIACPMCECGDESAVHLFTACNFATRIWSKISSWCNVPFPLAFSFKDVVEAFRYCGLKGKLQLAFQGIAIIACWAIWIARNELVFSARVPKVEEVFCSIRSLGFIWFKNRSKCIDISWEDWCKFV
ncbi:putative reverse transcriptase zinc-binding domain-containing protein [Helianthus annuus]|nr:putative reverse transcriptase zinc-binding domain-containing protein [Helianthus annuus]